MLHPWKRTQVHSSGGLKHTLDDGRAEHHQPGISLLGNNSDQSGFVHQVLRRLSSIGGFRRLLRGRWKAPDEFHLSVQLAVPGEPVIQSWLEAALGREAHGEVQVLDQLLRRRLLLMCNGEFPCYGIPFRN
jgi:hypothetical protein